MNRRYRIMKLLCRDCLFLLFLLFYLSFSIWLVIRYDTTIVLEFTRFAHDNCAHLYIPATVIDNGETSRFANLGTVWPFFYHLIMTPLVISDYLYRTGLAGSIVNAFLVAGTVTTISRIVKGRYGVIVAILFGCNVYSIIHASSSYMVPLGQFLSILSAFYAYKYFKNSSGRDLTKSVLLLMLATLARYEAWPMIIVLMALIAYREYKYGRIWRIYSYTPLALFGIAGWIFYNWAIFGNPFEFITHPSLGASGYYFLVIFKILKPWTIAYSEIKDVLWNILGPLLVLLPVGVLGYLKEEKGWQFLLFLLSSSALLLAEGPQLLIKDHALYYYFSFPFLFILAGKGLELLTRNINKTVKLTLISMLLVSYGIFLASEFSMLNTELQEGYQLYLYNKDIGNEIKMQWKGGYILYSSLIGSYYFSVVEGIKPRYILDEYDNPIYETASLLPWTYNVTIIVFPDREKYTELREYFLKLCDKCYVLLYYENESWRREFLEHYKPLFNSTIELYNVPVIVYVRSDSPKGLS